MSFKICGYETISLTLGSTGLPGLDLFIDMDEDLEIRSFERELFATNSDNLNCPFIEYSLISTANVGG